MGAQTRVVVVKAKEPRKSESLPVLKLYLVGFSTDWMWSVQENVKSSMVQVTAHPNPWTVLLRDR